MSDTRSAKYITKNDDKATHDYHVMDNIWCYNIRRHYKVNFKIQ